MLAIKSMKRSTRNTIIGSANTDLLLSGCPEIAGEVDARNTQRFSDPDGTSVVTQSLPSAFSASAPILRATFTGWGVCKTPNTERTSAHKPIF